MSHTSRSKGHPVCSSVVSIYARGELFPIAQHVYLLRLTLAYIYDKIIKPLMQGKEKNINTTISIDDSLEELKRANPVDVDSNHTL